MFFVLTLLHTIPTFYRVEVTFERTDFKVNIDLMVLSTIYRYFESETQPYFDAIPLNTSFIK